MPLPNTPLPLSQKTVSLSTRNRKLPQVPKNVNGNAVGVGLTNPNAASAKPAASSWASKVRNSKSFNLPFASLAGVAVAAQRVNGAPRTGRGAKLPVIPGTVHGSSVMRNRPDR
jgi:hypothetical protein